MVGSLLTPPVNSIAVLLLLVCLRWRHAKASDAGLTARYHPEDLDTGRNLVGRSALYRYRQRWILHEFKEKKIPDAHKIIQKCKGTTFSLRYPSRERVSFWFGTSLTSAARDCDTTVHSVLRRSSRYNHNLVGMTNPTISIDTRPNLPIGIRVAVKEDSEERRHTRRDSRDESPSSPFQGEVVATTAATSRTAQLAQLPWWPGVSQTPNSSWRLLRFRQTVGHGPEIYRACRDAALQWEFDTGSKGMVAIDSSSSSPAQGRGWSRGVAVQDAEAIERSSPNSVLQIWSGPGRRLASYTATGSKWFKIYTVNPVTVVYDLVDQRGPATTYTSTAYATCAGHLLRGEERVTVCHRDDDEGTVDVEILSYSKPADSLTGRLVWPLIGGMQRAFFLQQMESFQQVADNNSAKVDGTAL